MTIASSTSHAVPLWRLPREAPVLGSDEVHVWRAALDQSPSQRDGLLCTLAKDEQAKAGRFYFQIDRERSIVARGALREILGLYMSRAAQSVSFCHGPQGKPALDGESGIDAIHFNVSHSHGLALFAVTRRREVGIDLEFIREGLDAEQLAGRFFSQREIATLRALPTGLRKHAFFLCWSRKEAYIKARGEGLSMPLDQFDVSLIPGEPAALLGTRPDSDEAARWSLRDLSVAPGYVSALAVEGRGWSLSCWQWNGSLNCSAGNGALEKPVL